MFNFLYYKKYHDLSDKEVLALAIYAEEEDSRIYQQYASYFLKEFPETALLFQQMSDEENEHRRQLLDLFKLKFGDIIPLIKREYINGFYNRRPIWLIQNLKLETVRNEITKMEDDAAKFYYHAAQKSKDPNVRKLLGDLAIVESKHSKKAQVRAMSTQNSITGINEINKDKFKIFSKFNRKENIWNQCINHFWRLLPVGGLQIFSCFIFYGTVTKSRII